MTFTCQSQAVTWGVLAAWISIPYFRFTVCHYVVIFIAMPLISQKARCWSGSLLTQSPLLVWAFELVTGQRKDHESKASENIVVAK